MPVYVGNTSYKLYVGQSFVEVKLPEFTSAPIYLITIDENLLLDNNDNYLIVKEDED